MTARTETAQAPQPVAAPRRCEAIGTLNDARCRDSAGGRYMRACVHEHMEPKWLCPGHIRSVATALCGPCFDHPDMPHRCRISLIPLDGAA